MVDVRVPAAERSRRSDILAAAEREFAQAGWAGGRVERIAARARVNKQLLFHYFDSKRGLYAAVLRAALARLEPVIGEPATPVEAIRRLMEALESAARSAPGILLAPEHVPTEDLPPEALAELAAWRGRQLARLAETVADGQRRGHFRDDLDPTATAAIALAIALGGGALGRRLDGGAWMVDHCAWR
jgi:AcrR family transcriptional regulator